MLELVKENPPISKTVQYYYVPKSIEITEREWDGHRGHTVGTGQYETLYVVYKKQIEGPDEWIHSYDTKQEAEQWIKDATNKFLLQSLKTKFNTEIYKLNDTKIDLDNKLRELIPLLTKFDELAYSAQKIRKKYNDLNRMEDEIEMKPEWNRPQTYEYVKMHIRKAWGW